MKNRDELRHIHAEIIRSEGCSALLSVQLIASTLNRKESTVWKWLSKGKQTIPDDALFRLKHELGL